MPPHLDGTGPAPPHPLTSADRSTDGGASGQTSLDLYWIPLGAGARVVRRSGRAYEALHALTTASPRCDLYHSALIATDGAVRTTIEMTPVSDSRGRTDRGVVAEGAVGSRLLGRLRVFRYEVRRWPGGTIPDLCLARAAVRVTETVVAVRRVLELVEHVPTPVWGRDELGVGEMWNSNSVVSWTLAGAGLLAAAGDPPAGGRAPGWDAGVRVAGQGVESRSR